MGSAQVILLDTHVALWFSVGSGSLGRRSQRICRQAATDSELAVSAVSFWELALLIAKRRLRSQDSAGDTRRLILDTGAMELPLTGEIAILAAELGGLHGDPADRFIAATAIAHGATLVTADQKLLKWRHSLRRQNAEL
jgi:PIN domain nuclease of toxin-antitoxin system